MSRHLDTSHNSSTTSVKEASTNKVYNEVTFGASKVTTRIILPPSRRSILASVLFCFVLFSRRLKAPKWGGGGEEEEKGRKERKEKKKEHFPKFEGRWKRGQLAVLVNNGVSR